MIVDNGDVTLEVCEWPGMICGMERSLLCRDVTGCGCAPPPLVMVVGGGCI